MSTGQGNRRKGCGRYYEKTITNTMVLGKGGMGSRDNIRKINGSMTEGWRQIHI